MSQGVIYYAVGMPFVKDAIRSAKSLKKNTSDIPATLFTDTDTTHECFDQIISIETPKNPFLHYIDCMKRTPYDRTLFLDTDTYIYSDISDLFKLLDVFDIAVAHDLVRSTGEDVDIPESFPECNTGVILFANNDDVFNLLTKWEKRYGEKYGKYTPDEDQFATEQAFFTEELYKSNLRINILPPEYNCRFNSMGYVQQDAKILHGKHKNISEIANSINKNSGMMRVFTGPWHGRIYAVRKFVIRPVHTSKYPGPGRYKQYLKRSKEVVRNEGFGTAIRKGVDKLF